uniref:Mantis fibroin 2 n=1 Tax=Tenodera australasiae TaxID=267140 RepID=I3PM92_9NEOP|nr:mantis fibroin 2 [Tenodera australasiae]
MKFHIAFVLLVIFGAAQAGKKHEVMTYGSGYKHMGGETYEDVGTGNRLGSTAFDIMEAADENTERASHTFGSKSAAYSSDADLFIELLREKRETRANHGKRAESQAVLANESYQKSQLHKRQAKDKQAISKEYEERAQKHDRLSKEQDMKEHDDYRKSNAEDTELRNSVERSNYDHVMALGYHELSQLEMGETNQCEQLSRELQSRAEEYFNLAKELKEKAKKEKENARIKKAKAKEEEARAEEYENAFTENSKKVLTYKFYELEFGMKALNEHHQAESARVRHHFLQILEQHNSQHADMLWGYAQQEDKDGRSFTQYATELSKQTKMLTATAAHLMKQHRYTGMEMYSKQPFPHSNYHG